MTFWPNTQHQNVIFPPFPYGVKNVRHIFLLRFRAFLWETSSAKHHGCMKQNVVIDERSFLPFAVVFVVKDSEEELIIVALLFAFYVHRL